MFNYSNKSFIEESIAKNFSYKNKDLKIIDCKDFSFLGKFLAIRFIEWLQQNKSGYISFAPSRNLEYFVKWVTYILSNWHTQDVETILKEFSLNPDLKPDLKNYFFVQNYELVSDDNNSLTNIYSDFIKKFYIDQFGFDQSKVILFNDPEFSNHISNIEKNGEIGFFLGSINFDYHDKTGIYDINYRFAVNLSVDIGGMEVLENKKIFSLGFDLLAKNPNVTILLMVAGPDKPIYLSNFLDKLEFFKNKIIFYLTSNALSSIQQLKEDFNNLNLIKNIDFNLNDLSVSNLTYLHTSPHHDDIMLGYLPYIFDLLQNKNGKHYFATMTSGFNSVSNRFMLEVVNNLQKNIEKIPEPIRLYLENFDKKQNLKQNLQYLNDYFSTAIPGQKDPELIQNFKGFLRELEEEELWSYFGFDKSCIYHLRLGFYKSDFFKQKLDWQKDIEPIYNLIEKLQPNILTVAIDPAGSGPDTHYKVLCAIKEALNIYQKNYPERASKIKILGYRNVWNKFDLDEANMFIPVNQERLFFVDTIFKKCFKTQYPAIYPSPEYDGPFSELAIKVMIEQYDLLKKILGSDFFEKNQNLKIKKSKGFIFLKLMQLDEFLG